MTLLNMVFLFQRFVKNEMVAILMEFLTGTTLIFVVDLFHIDLNYSKDYFDMI